MGHPMATIMPQGIPLLEDLLRVGSGSTRGDLLINGPGGDANTAEEMRPMCRSKFKEEFNVIVPNYAKSAPTMIALG